MSGANRLGHLGQPLPPGRLGHPAAQVRGGQEAHLGKDGKRMSDMTGAHPDSRVQLGPPCPRGASIWYLALQVLDSQVLFLQVALLLGHLLEE